MYPGQIYTLPLIEPSGTDPTTPGQFDMWQNADVPRSGVAHPLLIEHSGT